MMWSLVAEGTVAKMVASGAKLAIVDLTRGGVRDQRVG